MTSTGFLYLCLIVIFTGVVNSSSDNSAQVYQINPRTNISQHGNSKFGWLRFHTLDEIYDWLDGLQKKFPKNVQVIVAGVSTENRLIKGVHLKFSENKKAVFIEGGIHAREWLSHSTSTYLINELLTSERPDIRQLAASYEWYIFPSVNPDGYPTSMNYRLWRKNRSKSSSLSCYQGFCGYCNGVDLNRNWDFYWGGKPGTFHDTCSEIYPGTSAFSESETKSLSKYINGIAPNLFAYISFHSYSQKLIFPYGHTINRVNNYDEQYSVALDAVKALSKRHQTQYEVGSIGELMGEATGSSLDWLKNKYNIPFAYCYELRGQTSSGRFYGFVAPPSEITPVAEEVMDSLLALFLSATKRKRYSQS
ncbi:zinc carboxypeptidase-like [Copidosoma floridanum]|uniref:zinc carboxypeptidase-like n=1 Tax=Copidosoma floridanum TaxID=29053 RepID=UPI000C6F6A63|nr:zinc carboxypeptidase-like [Copidosoma floridanum]